MFSSLVSQFHWWRLFAATFWGQKEEGKTQGRENEASDEKKQETGNDVTTQRAGGFLSFFLWHGFPHGTVRQRTKPLTKTSEASRLTSERATDASVCGVSIVRAGLFHLPVNISLPLSFFTLLFRFHLFTSHETRGASNQAGVRSNKQPAIKGKRVVPAMDNPYDPEARSVVLYQIVPADEAGGAAPPLSPDHPNAETPPTVSHEILDALVARRAGLTATDALAALFPPVDAGVVDGIPMARVASQGHTDRMDVILLQEALEKKCSEGGARPQGVCPVREAAYSDTLNELVRQIAVECPERGVLVALLRDEAAETNRTYARLFEGACQYGVRKELERDLKRTMQTELARAAMEASILENRVAEVRAKLDGAERRLQERRAAEEKRHQEEVSFLKKGNQQLTNEIKRLTA